MSDHTPQLIHIQLSRGFRTVVDPQDADLIGYKWWAQITRKNVYAWGYLDAHGTKRPYIYMHRIILSRMLGRELAKGECVDHRDGNSLNNSRSNLRLATYGENLRNTKARPNLTRFKGVKRTSSGRYQARIHINYREIYLGTFDTPEEAHEAYKDAAVEHFGEFARFE